MPSAFAGLISQIKRDYDLDKTPLHPDVNEKELEEDKAEKEEEDLRKGAVLKGIVESGTGDAFPAEGDLVFVHLAYSDGSGTLYQSTRSEHDGSGIPEPYVLGKDDRLLRGVHLALEGATAGERALLTIQPGYAFGHKDCAVPPPVGLDSEQPVQVDVQLTHWYPRKGVRNIDGSSGIYKRILKEVDEWESPRIPFQVAFRISAYEPSTSGRFEELNPVFTSGDKDIETQLGSGDLPEGVEIALGSMKIGERAVVSVPARLLSPSNRILLDKESLSLPRLDLLIELVDFTQVRDLADDGGVIKRILKKGAGLFPMDCPVEDSQIIAHWRLRKVGHVDWQYDSKISYPDGVTFDTGMKIVPDAVDLGVRLMLPGEVALLTSTWKYSYEGRTDAPEGVEEGDDTEVEVELVSFKSDRNWQRAEAPERLEFAKRFKEQGNTLYKQGEYKLAKVKYLKAAKAVDRSLHCENEEQQKTADDLLTVNLPLNRAPLVGLLQATTRVNLGQCAIKQQEYGEALFWCNKAIEDFPTHAKAFLRHGIALSYLGEGKAAREELEYASALEPSLAPEVARELALIASRERASDAKAKTEFGSFFKS